MQKVGGTVLGDADYVTELDKKRMDGETTMS